MAEAFVRWGAKVTLIEGGDQLMRTLDADMAQRLLEPMKAMGIDVRLGAQAARFEPGRVFLADESSLATDLVVMGPGVSPNAQLGAAAGLAVGARGPLVVARPTPPTPPGVSAGAPSRRSPPP